MAARRVSHVGNSDLFFETLCDVEKVFGAVSMVTQLGSEKNEITDGARIIGFFDLIEDRLEKIQNDLKAAMHALDERVKNGVARRIGQGPTGRSVPIKRRKA
jgi:hypothetical protein